MSNQLALFTAPGVRHDDPDTSRVAAETVKPGHQGRLESIARYVAEAGTWGATADEVWQRACLDDEHALKRRSTWHGAVSRAAEAGLISPRNDGARRLSVLNVVMTVYVTQDNQRGSK